MAVVVIFGLMVATFLTLMVVPTLYYLFEQASDFRQRLVDRVRTIYWKPYPYLAGEQLIRKDSEYCVRSRKDFSPGCCLPRPYS
ncbi:MAG: hypothetical protein P8X39_04525, partial [Desulfofustis sp.]